MIDAGDGVVVPGFFDGHAHVVAAGSALTKAVLRPCTSMDEIEAELRRWVDANPDAPRVLGVGWVFSALPDSTPHRQLLDAIVPDKPVYLDASDLHSVWCNSRALAELGITADTPDPIGGEIVRDEHGVATGHLQENAGYMIAWPVHQPGQRRRRTTASCRRPSTPTSLPAPPVRRRWRAIGGPSTHCDVPRHAASCRSPWWRTG